MKSKISNLKEKFKTALTSTAKVIAEDFENKSKSSLYKKKDTNVVEIDDLNNPSDFIRLRAETDSAALIKKIQY